MQNFLDKLYDVLMYVPLKIWELLLDSLASILESLPVPDFINNVSGYAASIPSDVIFFVAPFKLGLGISFIGGAYVLRFLIRRIPIIG